MTSRSDRGAVPPPIHGPPGFREHIDPLHLPDEGMAPDERRLFGLAQGDDEVAVGVVHLWSGFFVAKGRSLESPGPLGSSRSGHAGSAERRREQPSFFERRTDRRRLVSDSSAGVGDFAERKMCSTAPPGE